MSPPSLDWWLPVLVVLVVMLVAIVIIAWNYITPSNSASVTEKRKSSDGQDGKR